MRKRILGLVLASCMFLTACGADANKPTITTVNGNSVAESDVSDAVENDEVEVSDDDDVFVISDLKAKYGVSEDKTIKPFYNVEQDTSFTFHFNSMVEPNFAVTVHTDSKCEPSSMVYQMNDAYKSGSGVDVVVKPGSAVLKCDERADNVEENYKWGNAPIYYLCIRYDMDTQDVSMLSEPIVVPFTVKNKVGVPTVTANIDTNGVFHISWLPVDGAVKYNIYEANRVRSESYANGMSRAEAGFVGDHLVKLTSVDGDVTDFSDFACDGTNNTKVDENGYVISQNFYELGSFYVTAVDAGGNESFFSYPVSGWKFESQMPEDFSSYETFKMDDEFNIVSLPEVASVKFADNSYASMPINYTYITETEYGNAIYKYNIVGTLLSGEVEYKSPSGVYEKEILSSKAVPTGIYDIQNEINLVPSNDTATIIDDVYSMSSIDISGISKFDESLKLAVSSDALLARADLENARIVTDGVYTKAPFSYIDTYLADGSESTSLDTDDEVTSSEEPEAPKTTEITSDNLVEKQIESTNKQVEEANNTELPNLGYPVFADSAEEEYLARMMIDNNQVIDVSAFPKLQNTDYLMDVLPKVMYQNPYIISPKRYGYSSAEQAVYVEYGIGKTESERRQKEIYAEAESIASSIFTDDMSDEEKCLAIWEYLEQNTVYDASALEAAKLSGFTDVTGFEDSFNAYGILVDKVGVCQSYSYAYHLLADLADLDVITITGYLQKTLPHAWNAINLDGTWYWLDATNNENVLGFPYALYQTSYDTAVDADYVIDEGFALDTDLEMVMSDDDSKDWYYQNGMVASSDSELAAILADQLNNKRIMVAKLAYMPNTTSQDFAVALYTAFKDKGMTDEEFEKLQSAQLMGYFLVRKGE